MEEKLMDDELAFLCPEAADWRGFLSAAEGEGWRVPATEIELFKGSLAGSALALRCGGRFAGLVTAVNHGASAWIGNLLVPPAMRGKGYGKQLLDQAILRLEEQQVRSIWLTASEAGFPLYRRRRFEIVGQVERWIFAEGSALRSSVAEQADRGESLLAADASVWGEKRPLPGYLLPRSKPLQCGSSAALLQREPGLQILGPWVSDNAGEEEHRQLLALATGSAKADEELVIDVRAGALAPQLLQEAGFTLRGQTQLMARGDLTGIDLERLVSFASLGSMG
jgi:GNAT superfamily N-acetyltransferase